MRSTGASLPLLAALCLSACAQNVAEQRTLLDATATCCERLADLPYVPLQVGSLKSIKLAQGVPAFQFPTGKSYFFAGQLPAYSGPLELVLESTAQAASFNGRTMSVLRPEVQFLDEAFRPTRHVRSDAFEASRGANRRLSIFVNDENAGDRYVVIYVDNRAQQSEQVRTYVPTVVPIGAVPVVIDGREQSAELHYAPAGLLTLDLRFYRPEAIKR